MRASAALALASCEALKSPETFRLGAVVLRRSCVLAAGHNRNLNAYGLSSIHAEMDALWKVHVPKNTTVVVVRLRKDGTWACSRPCAACEKALKKARVSRVIYTTGCFQKPVDAITF